jgi:hypothetical protein
MVDAYPSENDEREAEAVLTFLRGTNTTRVAEIYRKINKFARIYVREEDLGHPVPEATRIEAVRNTIVPMITKAMEEAGMIVPEVHIKYGYMTGPFAAGQHGGIAENAKNHAAYLIYAQVVVPEIALVRAEIREKEEMRRFAIEHGYQPKGGRRTPGSVLDIPTKTLGHAVEARMNAAAKRAGLLGRR